jgi:hypothetical protein
MKKTVLTLFAVLGITIAVCVAQPNVQAAESVAPVESNTTLTVTVVPIKASPGRSWTQIGVKQSVTVADIMPVSISNLGDQFVVNWAGVYVYGTRQANDTWQVKCLSQTLTWDSMVNDLKLSGTFDYTFFAGTPNETTQTFTGDLFLDSSADMLYATWSFVPTGNAKP